MKKKEKLKLWRFLEIFREPGSLVLRSTFLKGVVVCALMLLPMAIFAQSNTITINGRVVDQFDEPIPGVTVVLKESATGTITDALGNYNIQAPENGVLVFSFIGFRTKEVTIEGRTTINVMMEEDVLGLDEVVVVGYGTVRASDVTGSVSRVTSAQIESMPVQNPLQALQGRAAGVDITSSARPGEIGSIRIRGNRSITASNEPLFVVDGIPLAAGGIEAINPNDINSIEILKDASATAIYGSRGANGVVLISTKRAQTGVAQVNYHGTLSFERINDLADNFNSHEYAEFRREAYRTFGQYSTPFPNPSEDYAIFGADPHAWNNIAEGYSWIDRANRVPQMRAATAEEQARYGVTEVPVYDGSRIPTTDWTDFVERTGITQDHNVSISMGTDRMKTYMSAGVLDQQGTNVGQDYTRYTGMLSLEFSPNDWLTVGGNITGSYAIQNYGYTTGGTRSARTIYDAAKGMLPFAVPYDDNGNFLYNPGGDANIVNPIREGDMVTNERTTIRTLGSFFAEIQLFEGLKYRANFGPDFRNHRSGEYNDALSITRGTGSGTDRARYQKNQWIAWTFDNLLYYNTNIDNVHDIGVTLLQSSSMSRNEGIDNTVTDLPYSSQLWYNLGSTNRGEVDGWGSWYSKSTLMSYMARINYAFLDRYLVTVSGRWDGASVLADGNKWDFFPSFALAWKLHQEDFMMGVDLFNELKPRIGMGTTGAAAISPYSTQGGLVRIPYVFGTTPASGYVTSNPKGPAAEQGSLPNRDLGWEKTTQWNFGVDFGILRNRISGSIDYYVANTSDLLLNRGLPSVSGYNQIIFNVGKTKNSGVELVLNSININTGNFRWDTNLSFSRNNEEIVELYQGKEDDISRQLFIGQPINVFYDYEKVGIWQLEDAAEMQRFNDNGHNYRAGDIRVRDLNGDYSIDPNNDRKIVGTAAPKWTGGITNTFKYDNWEMSVFVYSRWGHTVATVAPDMQGRYQSRKIDYWTSDNPTNAYPRPDYGNGGQPTYWSSMNYVDGSFVKVRNISLGYTVPRNIINNWNITNLKLYAQVMNPFLYSRTDYIDPDVRFDSNFTTSISSRSFVLGLNVTF
ncbi:SusC/RagA family TonB-linked outer membrane protein [Natronoflexus pectinivorans]|uniref:TonB-linked SusC/RagA family outer membrane protein n=1 Tax=Natronoflexus pectinivorans TaxID=682526 RepID=A0A4R2GKS8_9BACT|nr:TonB-dependent receptor [Natronoflexus pectinivorans]TCO08836.1 TonB-linked SusC/RagA family outer membrane protein [Natronoflexus pectinivorans]